MLANRPPSTAHRPPGMLFLLPNLNFGGAETQTVEQVNHLHGLGHPVFLAVLDGGKLALLDKVALPPERVFLLKKSGLTPFRLARLPKLAACAAPLADFVWANDIQKIVANLPSGHLLARLVKRKLGEKTPVQIFHYHHSTEFSAGGRGLSQTIFNGLNRWLGSQWDDGHIYISEAVRVDYEAHVRVKNGCVIHNAVALKEADAAFAQKFLREKSLDFQRLIVVPGRVHEVKGQMFLLDALAPMLQMEAWRSKKIALVFAGGGPAEAQVRAKIASLGLAGQCLTTGYLPNEQLLSFVQLAELVLIPSLVEGFGNVALEGLMLGKTMLASDAGGLPEIIRNGENGWLFRVGDAADLREKLAAWLENPAFFEPKMLQQEFAAKYTIDSQVRRLLDFLNAPTT
jgi:glycosyltransferase involved in cell wall biosynthesis